MPSYTRWSSNIPRQVPLSSGGEYITPRDYMTDGEGQRLSREREARWEAEERRRVAAQRLQDAAKQLYDDLKESIEALQIAEKRASKLLNDQRKKLSDKKATSLNEEKISFLDEYRDTTSPEASDQYKRAFSTELPSNMEDRVRTKAEELRRLAERVKATVGQITEPHRLDDTDHHGPMPL